ncbi:type II toxin-antitoxin system HicB family antitoxin [Desulfocastanea catecholica]
MANAFDEAVEKSREAIGLWIETVLDDNGTVPAPGLLADHVNNPDYKGWVWAGQYQHAAPDIIQVPRLIIR